MIEGKRVKLGGEERILAPLTLKTLKRLAPRLGELKNMSGSELPSSENFDLMSEMILASLHRNYPEVTTDQLDDWLDTSNLLPVFVAVLKGTGLEEKSPGEAPSP